MKKFAVSLLASALLLACVGCNNPSENQLPGESTQPGTSNSPTVVQTNDAAVTADTTLQPAATFYVPDPTEMVKVTASPADNEPFAPGAFASYFVKTPEKAEFKAPGYMGYTIANSVADIEAYMEKFSSMFDFESEFKAFAERYTEDFFEHKSLVFIMHEEAVGAGSGRVDAVDKYNDYVSISIVCDTDWSAYDDPNSVEMTQWHCIVEMNTDDIVNNDITVFEYDN
ncbi:MAG: hypothetical protein IJO48_07370 [Clostridia bacterium]|nr:hypothetical protein [Clostridia bacterium]